MNRLIPRRTSFSIDPPIFSLAGISRGGPPSYVWRKDGMVLVNSTSFSVSIALTGSGSERFTESVYESVLTVTGRHPGVYSYSVSNRITPRHLTKTLNITGILMQLYRNCLLTNQ